MIFRRTWQTRLLASNRKAPEVDYREGGSTLGTRQGSVREIDVAFVGAEHL